KKKLSALNNKLNFVLADNNPKKFSRQVKSANTIYIKGGSDSLLQKKIKAIGNFEELIQGKTIAGASAGANLFSKYYYSTDNCRVEEGLGILQIKLFTHYASNCRTELRELFGYKDDLEITSLLETDFVIIDIRS
nr:Type 1 glutamine amidotransferase-like domain-containing protein [Patescibacteria group bacterium]